MNSNKDDEKKQVPRFTTIYHKLRIKCELGFIEYCLLDSIHKLGSNPRYKYWCLESQKQFADLYGCSRRQIIRLYDKHINETGYLERPKDRKSDQDTRIRTTQKYYDEFVVFIPTHVTSIQTIPGDMGSQGSDIMSQGSDMRSHNSYSYKDSNKELTNPLTLLKGEDIPYFIDNLEMLTFLKTKGKEQHEIDLFIAEENDNCPHAYAAFNMAREKYPEKSANYICGTAYKILQSNQHVHESFDR